MYKPLLIASLVSLTALPAHAFDQQTTEALTACHAYLWDVPDYAELPNAAISVFPGITNDASITVFWNVYWDEPVARAAGNCTIIDGTLVGFEDYTATE